MNNIKAKLRIYWPLIKSLQTGLLMTTGLAGYMSARCPVTTRPTMLGLALSLFLTISGSTILNMWYDRDIDAKMVRTTKRPLPAGKLEPQEALRLGLIISIIGISIAAVMDPLYGLIIFLGRYRWRHAYLSWARAWHRQHRLDRHRPNVGDPILDTHAHPDLFDALPQRL